MAGNGKKILNILLVEDEKISQKVIQNLLQTKGWNVTIASDGEEALKILEFESFDIALMDIHIPKIDGLQLTSIIRKFIRPEERMPIIAMTASDSSKYKEECFKRGMNGYITKPVEGRTLFSTIEQIMQDNSSPIPGMDLKAALDNLEGDKELLKELMGDFIKEEYIQMLLKDIEEAINTREYDNLYKKAHKLKGAAACLNINSIHHLASKLEEIGRSKQDNNVLNIFNELKREYVVVEKVFKDYIKYDSI